MNILDIIIVIPVLYGLIRGLFRGLVKELTGIFAIGAGIVCAKIWALKFGTWIQTILSIETKTATIFAYILIILSAFIVVKLIGMIICKLLKAVELGGMNRILGALFGGGKWLLIVAFLLLGFSLINNRFEFVNASVIEESKFYQPVLKIANLSQQQIETINISNSETEQVEE